MRGVISAPKSVLWSESACSTQRHRGSHSTLSSSTPSLGATKKLPTRRPDRNQVMLQHLDAIHPHEDVGNVHNPGIPSIHVLVDCEVDLNVHVRNVRSLKDFDGGVLEVAHFPNSHRVLEYGVMHVDARRRHSPKWSSSEDKLKKLPM
jgi:hypothetical protein